MKVFKSFILIVFLITVFSGCSIKKDEVSTMEKIQNQLKNMESYQCTGTLTRISNKSENVYEIKQYYKSTGEYKLEMLAPEDVAGNYTVYNGESVFQYNPRIQGKVIQGVPKSQMRNELFLGCFIKNYFQSEDVTVETGNMDIQKSTVLEAVIPGENKYTATEKLWIDEETLKPLKLVIYDTEGKERYIIEYKDFEYNIDIDENIFKIPEV
ncbi:hypothetical protein B5E58_00400 [Tyzzerella sp. An114]|uniref:LolA family protein n=1 Tax=Tyzzerella sp. An114 TaxID=1965545 RepID=UPI000B450077|nr:outer membrane lipoprotein carrier protein LolA [Tyzzerella sp. An114]OUQ60364.1 hypothetical protein B5E58_00400 [Tyzzerella sp. An114]HIT72443.1 outer membrane lipoprotein carrier protein LolA [Candidatus Fimicola cottocaccae]